MLQARLLPFLLGAALAAIAGAARAEPPDPAAAGRVIVLGFDGADARTTQALLDAGQLPNLKRLAERGTFAPLGTTSPAESTVSWAALNSGQNPGKTGVLGFVKREQGAHAPRPAPGHQTVGMRTIDELEPGTWLRLLAARTGAEVATGAGALVLAVGFLFFAFVLRLKKRLAALVAALLAALAAWAGARLASYVPRSIEEVVGNPTQAPPFWEVAAAAGVPAVVLDGAMCWDRAGVENLRVLSGLGVPDARGANCDWFVYTTESTEFAPPPEGRSTGTGGRVFRVDEVDGRIESHVFGPRDLVAIDRLRSEFLGIHAELVATVRGDPEAEELRGRLADLRPERGDWRAALSASIRLLQERLFGTSADTARANDLLDRLRALRDRDLTRVDPGPHTEEGRLTLPLTAERRGGKLRIAIGGHAYDLAEGDWSPWYPLTFDMNPLVSLRAVTRVKLVRATDPVEIFLDSLQIDPGAPPFWQPISQPPGFAADLARRMDTTFETVGWACLTMPFKDREIEPETFLEDIEFTHGWRARMLAAALAQDDWRLLVHVESTPDRVQHMLYRLYDREHPQHDAALAARRTRFFGEEIALGDAIPASYRAMDRLVGEVVDRHLRPEDTLFVVSDHGFQSYRHSVNLNNWLAQAGYLVLREDLTSADSRALAYVDWSRTRAYALGLGLIFLNLKGREPQGLVEPDEAGALLDEISARLLELEHEGRPVVREVLRTTRVHSGPFVAQEADLMPGFEAGYRVGWSTTTGGIVLVEDAQQERWVAGPAITENRNNWSGDHVSVAQDLVTGIFFCSRPLAAPPPSLDVLHVAPTVLERLDVPVPADCDRDPLGF